MGWFVGKKFFDATLNHDLNFGYQAVAIDEKRKKFPISLWDESKKDDGQIIEQVWFAGVHSDVGGWYDERDLSDITLKWMIEKAEAAEIKLKPGWKAGLKPNPLGVIHESRTGFWRIWRPARREIPDGALIHQSVIERKNAEKYNYSPKLPEKFIPIPTPPRDPQTDP